jgi:hypothetical protein
VNYLKVNKVKKYIYSLKLNELSLVSFKVLMAYNQLSSYEIVISWQQNDKNKIN